MRKLFILLLMVIVLIPTVSAVETSSTNYITNIVIVPGANTVSSTNYNTTVLIGETLLGSTGSTNYNITFGFLHAIATIDTTAPIVTIYTPTTEDTKERTPLLNISVDDVSTIVYSIDGAANISACSSCTSYAQSTATIPLGTHNITVYATNTVSLVGNATITFRIYEDIGEAADAVIIPIIDENITNITEVDIPITQEEYEELTFFEKLNYKLDSILINYPDKCLMYGTTQEIAYFGLNVAGEPVYDVIAEHTICKIPVVVTYRPIVYFLLSLIFLIIFAKLYTKLTINFKLRRYNYKLQKQTAEINKLKKM